MPDMDDYSFEPEEPSIIPKKTYRKELFLLQVELNKLTGNVTIFFFEHAISKHQQRCTGMS